MLHAIPLLLALTSGGQVPPPQQTPPVRIVPAAPAPQTPRPAPPAYKEDADAKANVDGAIKAAATDDVRVLINWGANDDAACTQFVKAQRGVKPTFFSDEYKQVFVDVGHANKNLDLAAKYGVTIKAGALPALTVLDAAGKVIATKYASDFVKPETGTYDSAPIAAFLEAHQAPAPDAVAAFEAAVKQAKHDGKTVFVWFSAPW